MVKFNSEHVVFLQWILEGGNKQILATLELITGQTIEQHSTRIKIIADAKIRGVMDLMDFDAGPVASVISAAQGDLTGTLMFLHSERNFESLRQVMAHGSTDKAKPANDGNTGVPRLDWSDGQSHREMDSKRQQEQMLDVVGEMGNILFGHYLDIFYAEWNLITFQDIPVTSFVDDLQPLIMSSLSWKSKDTEVAIAIKIDYVIKQQKIQAWLLMVSHLSDLQTLIESIASRISGKSSKAGLSSSDASLSTTDTTVR